MLKYLDKVRIISGSIYETRNKYGKLKRYKSIEMAIKYAALYKDQSLIQIHIINYNAKNTIPNGPLPIIRDIKDIYCTDMSDRWISLNPEKTQIVFEEFDYAGSRCGQYYLFDYDILYNKDIILPQIGDHITSDLYKEFQNRILEIRRLPLNLIIKNVTRDSILYLYPEDKGGPSDVIIAYEHAEPDVVEKVIPYYTMKKL